MCIQIQINLIKKDKWDLRLWYVCQIYKNYHEEFHIFFLFEMSGIDHRKFQPIISLKIRGLAKTI